MKSKYFTNSPRTITDFRKIRKSDRNGLTPERMMARHDVREKLKWELEKIKSRPMSIVQYLKTDREYNTMPKCTSTIPFYGSDERPSIPEEHNRKKNWEASEMSCGKTSVKTNDKGRYSRRCTYTHYTYTHVIQSWGYVPDRNHVYIRIDTKNGLVTKIIKSPRGYFWTVDKHGIALKKSGNPKVEYHPNASDFLEITRQNGTRKAFDPIIKQADLLFKERKKSEKEQKLRATKDKDLQSLIRKSEREGCMVSMIDSIHAGNCRAGTESWIARNDLNMHRHEKPTVIMKKAQAACDFYKVKLVLLMAVKRHQQEMRQGYSILANHYDRWPVSSAN